MLLPVCWVVRYWPNRQKVVATVIVSEPANVDLVMARVVVSVGRETVKVAANVARVMVKVGRETGHLAMAKAVQANEAKVDAVLAPHQTQS